VTGNNLADGALNGFPLSQQLSEHVGPQRRDPVETLVALVLFAPLAYQQPLGLEPAQQRVERALLDLDALIGERLAQCVSVVLLPELSKHGEDQRSAPELQAKIVEDVL
jgi:hypothetical protein